MKNLDDTDIHLEFSDELLEEVIDDFKDHIEEVSEYEKYMKILQVVILIMNHLAQQGLISK